MYCALKTESTMSVRFVRTVMLPEMSEDALAEGTLATELADALATELADALADGLVVLPDEQAIAAPLMSRTAKIAVSRFPTVPVPPRNLFGCEVATAAEQYRGHGSLPGTMVRASLGLTSGSLPQRATPPTGGSIPPPWNQTANGRRALDTSHDQSRRACFQTLGREPRPRPRLARNHSSGRSDVQQLSRRPRESVEMGGSRVVDDAGACSVAGLCDGTPPPLDDSRPRLVACQVKRLHVFLSS